MAYTALETMRENNRARFGADLGPMQPPLYVNPRRKNDLKSAALRFLHHSCEGLRFDKETEAREQREGA